MIPTRIAIAAACSCPPAVPRRTGKATWGSAYGASEAGKDALPDRGFLVPVPSRENGATPGFPCQGTCDKIVGGKPPASDRMKPGRRIGLARPQIWQKSRASGCHRASRDPRGELSRPIARLVGRRSHAPTIRFRLHAVGLSWARRTVSTRRIWHGWRRWQSASTPAWVRTTCRGAFGGPYFNDCCRCLYRGALEVVLQCRTPAGGAGPQSLIENPSCYLGSRTRTLSEPNFCPNWCGAAAAACSSQNIS